MAQKRVSEQNKARQAQESARNGKPVSPQNAARVRTGNYTGGTGSERPKATPAAPSEGQKANKPYGNGAKNPYGRYSSSEADEDASYTASFKPAEGEKPARRKRSSDDDQTPVV